ncbi:hypothetical protein SAY87_016982 [Trapa incisa]|uniref:Uncharacterized protein n=1 Tax=Trapa incisa TaxID=236973 RepID=A0AAN7LHT6_9MYRT|nr:hypothetical protein SAY87_016982 [Trapa incisa]
MHPPRASSIAKVNATRFFTCDLRPRRYPVIASLCRNRRGDYQMRGIVIDMVHAKVCNFVIPNRVRVLELYPLQPALLLLVMEGFSEGRVPGLVHDGDGASTGVGAGICGGSAGAGAEADGAVSGDGDGASLAGVGAGVGFSGASAGGVCAGAGAGCEGAAMGGLGSGNGGGI